MSEALLQGLVGILRTGDVVEGSREEGLVVALLQLYCVRAGHVSRLEEFLGLLEAPLMVMTNLGDNEGFAVVRNFMATDLDRPLGRLGGSWMDW